MPLKSREFDKIIKKYGFKTKDSHHKLAWLEVDGHKIVRTRRSHIRGRDLPSEDAIRRQLHLIGAELKRAVSCHIDLEGHLLLLREKGVIA